MRRTVLTLTLAVALTTPAMAIAAPTCLDQNAVTMRCGLPGAMPVGWAPPPQVRARHDAMALGGADGHDLFDLICIVGGILTLIALMPDFDGAGGGWDEQQDDQEQD